MTIALVSENLKSTTKQFPAEGDYLSVACDVLENEAQALIAMKQSLGEPFSQAVDCLLSIEGRVIVTGMGKSGHVARKIAATLASTGQPAYFVHPAEASHGDLGMITEQDLVIALSNSGETHELANLLDYAKRFRIPVISISRKGDSTLSRLANVALVIPDHPEACPMGLAPTTSTTMMMALGDALAVALLKARGFSPADFKVYHPGGSLGGKLQRVRAKMHQGKSLPLVQATTPMMDALLAISEKGFGCVGVCQDIETDEALSAPLIGVITDGDLRRHMGDHLLQLTAEQVMTPNPTVIQSDTLMTEALALMNYKKITSLFIVDDNRPVGIIHIHDFLRSGVV